MGTTILSSSATASMIVWLGAALTIASSTPRGCLAWQGLPTTTLRGWNRGHHQVRTPQCGLYSTRTGEDSSTTMEGVADFEAWFSGIEGSSCNPYIKHDSFGALRGLGTFDRSIGSGNAASNWMKIPRSITLSSDFSQADWDATLAESLWREVVRGPASPVHGYVSLLTQSWSTSALPDVPPYPAQDALRHWTDAEREMLKDHPEGRALLDLQQQQERSWRAKHAALSSKDITWKQFEWAMEAVHSRAFCGDFGIGGGGGLPPLASLGAPAVAALACYVYFVPMHGQSDVVLAALALVGAIPSLWNLLRETQSSPVAVLLPLIDSANHLEDADSSIGYSPLTDSFELSGGPKCLVREDGGKQQLYISYGKKSDRELLLNYGFLKGTSYSNGDTTTERRKKLTDKFLGNQ